MKLINRDYNFFNPAYWFGDVDARPLGLFRIAFAALMLKEAIYHIFVAEVWYSEAGMFPARLLPRLAPNMPTLMTAMPDTWMAIVFFIFWALVAVLLLIGWQTRVMTILNMVFLVSVINRNPLVATGADSVMQAFAFWSIFLPLGRSFSLDARRRGEYGKVLVYAFPVRMFQIQIALIYIFTTIFKLQGQTWANGDALYMAMQIRMHTFPLAEWLLTNLPLNMLRVLTYLALLIEGAFAVLVFAPVFQPYLRAIGLVYGILLHIGIALVMNIPNFPLVMIIGYLMLIDPRWLDWLSRYELVQQFPKRVVPVPVQPTKSPTGCAAMLAGIPAAMGKGAYRALLAGILLAAMFSIIWGNVLSNERLVTRLHTPAMPRALEESMRAIGLWESWALFAPDPLTYEGWFGLNGIFPNTTYDVRSRVDRPRWYVGPQARWGKLEENLMTKSKDDPIFSAWAVYTCRQFRGSGILGLEIVLYTRTTSPPGQPFLPYQTQIIHGANCMG